MLPIRRQPTIVALRPALALALALLAGAAAAQRPEIAIPADPWTTAGRVYVLPVFYVPADSAHSAADAADPTLDLDGEPMAPAAARELHRAKRSLAAHLQVAQEKYRQMLVRPGNPPADRGTFTLATWADGAARAFDPAHGELEPYVHRSPNGSLEIIADHFFDADRWVYSELLDALGCEQQSCPFVFVIVYWGPQPTLALPTFRFSPMAGVSVNVGANGGAGYLYTDGATLLQAHLPTGPPFQSTLLHELGHAFGLPHVWEVYGGDTGGPAFSAPAADHVAYCARTRFEPGTEKYALACSRSVMSYNVLNRFFGCVELGGSPVPGFPGEPPVEHCVVPADPAAIDAVPGLLIAEDRYQLGLNTRVFPEHSFEEGVDLAEGESIRAYAGPGGWEVPGQATFRIVSSQGTPWPNRIAGMRSKPIPPRHEPFDAVAMWRAEPGPEGWVTLDLELPRAARISRLRPTLAPIHRSSGRGGTSCSTSRGATSGSPAAPTRSSRRRTCSRPAAADRRRTTGFAWAPRPAG